MKISVLCIGDELLKGATVNTNMAFIGRELMSIGIISSKGMVVADRKNELCEALDFLLPCSDLIITSGGLGPTADDVTKTVIADYLGLKLVRDENIAETLGKRWAKLKRGPAPEKVLNQALVIEGAQVLPNDVGTAPGIWIKKKNADSEKFILMLPGPPSELHHMFTNYAIPEIKKLEIRRTYSDLIYVAGLPESIAEERITPVIEGVDDLSVAYCASPGNVRIFLNSEDEELVAKKSAEIRELLKEHMLSPGNDSLEKEILFLLKKNSCRLATAESCTGGMIAAAVTGLPGSSDIFEGSFVTYSNESKIRLLGVDENIIKEHGAVSSECASAMLDAIRAKFGTEAGIAVTGIAGPGGGTEEKPVGLVYIAVSFREKKQVREYIFPGSRETVRFRTVSTSLNMLREIILKSS